MVDKIIGGVVNNNTVSYLFEFMMERGIDLDFEEHCKECENEDHEDCYICDNSTYIIGFKKDEETGLYEIDEDAEFSAITSEQYTQVIKSKYYSMCKLCCACYPMQGDLDNEGNNKTYALPEELYDEYFDTHLEIFEITEIISISSDIDRVSFNSIIGEIGKDNIRTSGSIIELDNEEIDEIGKNNIIIEYVGKLSPEWFVYHPIKMIRELPNNLDDFEL